MASDRLIQKSILAQKLIAVEEDSGHDPSTLEIYLAENEFARLRSESLSVIPMLDGRQADCGSPFLAWGKRSKRSLQAVRGHASHDWPRDS